MTFGDPLPCDFLWFYSSQGDLSLFEPSLVLYDTWPHFLRLCVPNKFCLIWKAPLMTQSHTNGHAWHGAWNCPAGPWKSLLSFWPPALPEVPTQATGLDREPRSTPFCEDCNSCVLPLWGTCVCVHAHTCVCVVWGCPSSPPPRWAQSL